MTRRQLCAAGLLLFVLLGHGLVLCWLAQRVQHLKPLIPMAEPMLTRLIEPVPLTPPLRRPTSRRNRSAGQLAAAQLPAGEVAAQPDPGAAENQTGPQATEQPPASGPEPFGPAPQLDQPGPAALAQQTAAADSWPADTRVSYRLRGNYRGELNGSARVQWQREQGRYQVRLDLGLPPVLQVSMISQGRVGEAGLFPGVYEEQLPWGLRRMVFEGDQVKFDNGAQLPQPPALQDTASQFVELSHRFSSGRDSLQVGSVVSVWLARPQGISLWTYDVIEEEVLQTPELGAVPAFHLRPRPVANPAGVITAEMWFAPSLQYLPVRVRIALGADNFVDLLVERVEQGLAPATPQGDWRDGR
ncbi:MAG: DUF3108 domain-containing protein [Rhodoferax sp.]